MILGLEPPVCKRERENQANWKSSADAVFRCSESCSALPHDLLVVMMMVGKGDLVVKEETGSRVRVANSHNEKVLVNYYPRLVLKQLNLPICGKKHPIVQHPRLLTSRTSVY